MEEITQDDVIEILKMIEESVFDELRLEIGELKLVVSKSGMVERPALKLESGPEEATASTAPEKTSFPAGDGKVEAEPPAALDDRGLVAIKAPMLGTFYSAPKPGAPSFVEVGQNITEDDTVCIIEVMKLFNTVKAGVQGRIAEICAENSQMVEYNQTLFLVKQAVGEDKTEEAQA